MDTYDVIVVGAGYGGASAAALLAHAGRRVALVEKNPRAGGKGATISRKGYDYEMWGAVGVPAQGSRFHELVDVLDIADRAPFIIPEGNAVSVHYKARSGEWRTSFGPAKQSEDPGALDRVKSVYGASDEDVDALATLFATMLTMSEEEVDALDDVGMLDFVRRFGLPPSLVTQVCTGLNMAFCVPIDRLPASEGVFVMRQIVNGGAGRYHAGGYGRVAEVCAEYVTEHGGAFLNGERVRRVLVEDGRAAGIETDSGAMRAGAVVSSAGIQPTVLHLVGAEHFPADYVERVRSLEPSLAVVGMRYIVDAPVFEAPIILAYSDQSWLDADRYARLQAGDWPDVPLISIGVPCLFDPSLVPEGHQVAISAVLASPDPTSGTGEEAIRRSEVVIDELWPDLCKHIVRTERYTARQVSRMTRDSVVPGQGGEAIGLAQVIGQCGSSKPDPRTPLGGLYLVGCDAGGRGAGTHQAVDSGFNVAAMVDADLS